MHLPCPQTPRPYLMGLSPSHGPFPAAPQAQLELIGEIASAIKRQHVSSPGIVSIRAPQSVAASKGWQERPGCARVPTPSLEKAFHNDPYTAPAALYGEAVALSGREEAPVAPRHPSERSWRGVVSGSSCEGLNSKPAAFFNGSDSLGAALGSGVVGSSSEGMASTAKGGAARRPQEQPLPVPPLHARRVAMGGAGAKATVGAGMRSQVAAELDRAGEAMCGGQSFASVSHMAEEAAGGWRGGLLGRAAGWMWSAGELSWKLLADDVDGWSEEEGEESAQPVALHSEQLAPSEAMALPRLSLELSTRHVALLLQLSTASLTLRAAHRTRDSTELRSQLRLGGGGAPVLGVLQVEALLFELSSKLGRLDAATAGESIESCMREKQRIDSMGTNATRGSVGGDGVGGDGAAGGSAAGGDAARGGAADGGTVGGGPGYGTSARCMALRFASFRLGRSELGEPFLCTEGRRVEESSLFD